MQRVLSAVVLVPLVLLAVLKSPEWLFIAITGVIAVLTAHEYLLLADHYAPTFRRTSSPGNSSPCRAGSGESLP